MADNNFIGEELSESAKRIKELQEIRERKAQESIKEIRELTEQAIRDEDVKKKEKNVQDLKPLMFGTDCSAVFDELDRFFNETKQKEPEQQFDILDFKRRQPVVEEDREETQIVSFEKVAKKSITNTKVSNHRQERVLPKNYIALKIFTLTATVSLLWPTVYEAANYINNYYPNHRMEQAFDDYEAIYKSKDNYNEFWTEKEDGDHQLDHSHDWMNIITELHASYPEPASAFYLIYNRLDDWCKDHAMGTIFSVFNSVYGTNYHSLEDVLKTEGLEKVKDLRNYAKTEFSRWEYREDISENESRDSSFGR